MTLSPLLAATTAIQIHAVSAMAAFLLGAWQLLAPKGTGPHRILGWVWAGLMIVVAASGFFIHQIRVWGLWSPIHLLSILVLVMMPLGVILARTGRVSAHRWTMSLTYLGGLVVAGAFTVWPGRIMHAVVFGP